MLKEFINGMSFLLSPFSRIFNDNIEIKSVKDDIEALKNDWEKIGISQIKKSFKNATKYRILNLKKMEVPYDTWMEYFRYFGLVNPGFIFNFYCTKYSKTSLNNDC